MTTTPEPDPDAEAYRWLRDEIGKTMADPLRWDGDDAEEAILARYVQWLAAERATVRTEVLLAAAEQLDDQSCTCGCRRAAAFLKYLAHSPEADRG
jgi:hypothetical protein